MGNKCIFLSTKRHYLSIAILIHCVQYKGHINGQATNAVFVI